MTSIALEPLTADAFSPFGDVVESAGAPAVVVNQGFARRFDTRALIDVADQGGRTKVSIFESRAVGKPVMLRLMERHPLGSQIFYPLQNTPWIVVVCSDPYRIETYRAFLATGRQGVNYRRNTWHHPLMALSEDSRFIVVDRLGTQPNLEEAEISHLRASIREAEPQRR